MTRGPRPTPPAERALTAADLERLTDRLGGKIDGSEERINDKFAEQKAQADARQAVTREARAQDQAKIEALTDGQRQLHGRMDEMVATNLRGYRTLEVAQTETKEAVELRLRTLEERTAPEAAEIALHVGEAVVKSNRVDNQRIAGAVIGAGGVSALAVIVGVGNFIASHTPFVLGILRFISFGVIKATGGASHE